MQSERVFCIFGDALSGPTRAIECLNGILQRADCEMNSASSFLKRLRTWACSRTIDEGPPESFKVVSWNVYLQSILSDRYFFSTSELALMCRVADINVAIFKQLGDDLVYDSGHYDCSGPVIHVK